MTPEAAAAGGRQETGQRRGGHCRAKTPSAGQRPFHPEATLSTGLTLPGTRQGRKPHHSPVSKENNCHSSREQDPFILTSQSKPQRFRWDTGLKTEVLMYRCPRFSRLRCGPNQETVQRAPSWEWGQPSRLFCNSLGPRYHRKACRRPSGPSGLRPVTRLANHMPHAARLQTWRADAGGGVTPWPAPWEPDLTPLQPQASSDGLPRKKLTSGLADSQLNKGLHVAELGAAFPRAAHLPPAS